MSGLSPVLLTEKQRKTNRGRGMVASYISAASPCDLCGSGAFTKLFKKNGFPVVRCCACGLVAIKTPVEFDLRSVYDALYFRGGQKDGYADYPAMEQPIRAEFRQTVLFLKRLCHDGTRKRLLEIGSAYGFFLDEAKSLFDCTGVEVCREAADFARDRGHTVFEGVLDLELAASLDPVDLVVMLDVIEHLSSPTLTLQAVHACLKPGGVLLVVTGNIDSLYARVSGKRWRLMTPPQHAFFFSRRTLTSLLESNGFAVVHTDRPWKRVPLGLAAYQVGARIGFRVRALEAIGFWFPANLFDTIRVLARKI